MSVGTAQACGLIGCSNDPYARAYVLGKGRRTLCEECLEEEDVRNVEVLADA